eukprot:gene25750-31500_t
MAQQLVAAQLDPRKASFAAPRGAEEEEEEEEILREQVELKRLLEGGLVGVPPAISLYSGTAFDVSGRLYPEALKPASRREQLINQTSIADGLSNRLFYPDHLLKAEESKLDPFSLLRTATEEAAWAASR